MYGLTYSRARIDPGWSAWNPCNSLQPHEQSIQWVIECGSSNRHVLVLYRTYVCRHMLYLHGCSVISMFCFAPRMPRCRCHSFGFLHSFHSPRHDEHWTKVARLTKSFRGFIDRPCHTARQDEAMWMATRRGVGAIAPSEEKVGSRQMT